MALLVDEKIMEQLLSEPTVKENVEKMTEKELEYYKQLLVSTGVYQSYALQKMKETVINSWIKEPESRNNDNG